MASITTAGEGCQLTLWPAHRAWQPKLPPIQGLCPPHTPCLTPLNVACAHHRGDLHAMKTGGSAGNTARPTWSKEIVSAGLAPWQRPSQMKYGSQAPRGRQHDASEGTAGQGGTTCSLPPTPLPHHQLMDRQTASLLCQCCGQPGRAPQKRSAWAGRLAPEWRAHRGLRSSAQGAHGQASTRNSQRGRLPRHERCRSRPPASHCSRVPSVTRKEREVHRRDRWAQRTEAG